MLSPGTFPSRFHEFSRKHRLFGRGQKIMVAVSGGVDSMVLLDLLAREREMVVLVAHVNHQLRGAESNEDEAFVAGRARFYDLPFHIERVDTAAEAQRRKIGIQEAARDLRYGFFRRLQASTHAVRIATAHHADDNAETILLHLFRGSGVQGMAGIPIERDGIIRPLLWARREEIEQYALDKRIPFRTDSSNRDDGYTRNAIRHRVLPLLEELIAPAVVEAINRSGENFRVLADYVAAETQKAMAQCVAGRDTKEVRLSISSLTSLPLLLRQGVVIAALEEATGHHPSSELVNGALELVDKPVGSRLTLRGRGEMLRDRETLLVHTGGPADPFCLTVIPGETYHIGGFSFRSSYVEGATPRAGEPGKEYVDADRIGTRTLRLRSWREGDAFIPLGMAGRKKISDFFVDEKIPLHEKHGFPVLETSDGEIVWVCGQRIDDRFKLTASTRHVLKVEFTAGTNG